MTTSNIYCLGSNYGYSMLTNQLFSLNFTDAILFKQCNQSESSKKSDIRIVKERTIGISRNRRHRIDFNQVPPSM